MRSVKKLVTIAQLGWVGRHWYDHANRELCDVCEDAGWDNDVFAGILAVTSPRCSVKRNIRIALEVMITGDLPAGVMVTIHQALSHYRVTGEIRGPKTSAFQAALLGCPDPVVLDVWMAYALCVDQKDFSRRGVRIEAADRVRQVGRILGITPVMAQAAIWTGQRDSAGRSYSDFPLKAEYAAHHE